MGKPTSRFITIETSPELAQKLLDDLFAKPRREIRWWSGVTGQTSQVRLAYPGQHLASVITGVKGSGTAARGVDLADGSEVKSCSRADQLGVCKNKECLAPVLPHEKVCPICGGDSITRKTDSHWIITIKTERELQLYLDGPRLVLILFDRPDDDHGSIRTRAWEIWPGDKRHEYFVWFLDNYFHENYQRKIEAGLTPAPCNLHPLKFDFYMMNPILTFEAIIRDADSEQAGAEVVYMADPREDRAKLDSVPMPASVVRTRERVSLVETMEGFETTLRSYTGGALSIHEIKKLRETDRGRTEIANALVEIDEVGRRSLRRPDKKPKMTPSTYERKVVR